MPIIKITWTDSITPGVTNHKIYRDNVLLQTVGVGVELYYDTTALGGYNYKYEVQAVSSQGESVIETDNVNVIQIITPDAYEIPTGIVLEAITSLFTPVLTNFRIESGQPSRVYFDTPLGAPTGLTTTGFIISDGVRTVTGVELNGTATTNHYFTVSSAFDFWDNDTIRLESGDGTVYDFTLEHIENNINEPATTSVTWLSPTGSGSKDGSSEANAASPTEFNAATLPAGILVNAKIGTYTTSLTVSQSGTVSAPIVIQGYKATPGDITSMYYAYGDGALDPAEMPLINSGSTNGFYFDNSNKYVICRNFQATNGAFGFRAQGGSEGVIFDNCIAKDIIGSGDNGYGIYMSGTSRVLRSRVINSHAENCSVNAITMSGRYNLYENDKVYTDDNVNRQDYFYQINVAAGTTGDNLLNGYNIHKNCLAYKDAAVTVTWQHCLSVAARETNPNATCTHNLVDGFTFVNLNGIELRRPQSQYNVVKRCTSYGDGTEQTGGIRPRDGSINNIIEQNHFKTGSANKGIDYYETASEAGSGWNNNTFRNNIFEGNGNVAVFYDNSAGSGAIVGEDNLYYNNTFKGYTSFTGSNGSNITVQNETFKNNIVDGIANAGAFVSGFTFDWNCFNSSWSAGIGTNDIEANPTYVSASDFEPTNVALLVAPRLVSYDKEGIPRATTTTIGAIKHANEIGGGSTPTYANVGYDLDDLPNNSSLTDMRAAKFTMSEDGTLKSISAKHIGTTVVTDTLFGVYADNAGNPGALLATTVLGTGFDNGWNTLNLTSDLVLTSGTVIWLAISASGFRINYGNGGGTRNASSLTSPNPLPDPYGSGTNGSYTYAIYATYEQ